MMRPPASILVIKLDEIGDAILGVPALRSLRHKYPDARITYVTRPDVLPLIERCPYVDRFVTLPRGYKTFGLAKISLFMRMVSFCLHQRLFGYAMSVVLHSTPYAQECLLSLAAGAKRRVGWLNTERRWSGVCFNQILSSLPIHEADRLMAATCKTAGLESAGALEIWLSSEDRQRVADIGAGVPCVAVGCNTAGLGRRSWPVERYGEVVKRLHERYPAVRFFGVGGREDIEAGTELVRLTGAYVSSLAGQLSLRETCAFLEQCVVFVGNDSGPMHMAAAVGTPVVEISCHPEGGAPEHPNAPERFGPRDVPHRICRPQPRPPCTRACESEIPHCILGVSADMVIAAVRDVVSFG